MQREELVLEYLDLSLRYISYQTDPNEVDEFARLKCINRIHEIRGMLGMDPITLS